MLPIKTEQALAPTTCNEWLKICEKPKDAISVLRGVKTVADAIDAGTPSLTRIVGEMGERYTLGYLKFWLVYFQGMINVKNKLSEDMVDFLAESILGEFWMLTIADIKKVLTDAINGVYGEFYESISIPKVTSWFRDYLDERMNVYEYKSMNHHMEVKNTPIVDEDLERVKLEAKRRSR